MERLTEADRNELDECYARCECGTCLRRREVIEKALRIIGAHESAHDATELPRASDAALTLAK